MGGATVTQVSQWHDETRQQICAWWHELKKKGLPTALPGALFLPVEVERPLELTGLAAAPHVEAARPAQVELQLANGRFLRFDPALDAITLTQVIRAVEAA